MMRLGAVFLTDITTHHEEFFYSTDTQRPLLAGTLHHKDTLNKSSLVLSVEGSGEGNVNRVHGP